MADPRLPQQAILDVVYFCDIPTLKCLRLAHRSIRDLIDTYQISIHSNTLDRAKRRKRRAISCTDIYQYLPIICSNVHNRPYWGTWCDINCCRATCQLAHPWLNLSHQIFLGTFFFPYAYWYSASGNSRRLSGIDITHLPSYYCLSPLLNNLPTYLSFTLRHFRTETSTSQWVTICNIYRNFCKKRHLLRFITASGLAGYIPPRCSCRRLGAQHPSSSRRTNHSRSRCSWVH